MPLSPFTPAAPINIREPFDHDDCIFELKMDGFRALAYVGEDETRLVSRRGNVYKSFPDLCAVIHSHLNCEAVLDGEIVCLDPEGRSQFYRLLRRRGRGEPVFYAFDLLWLDGEDLRPRPLIERKRLLRSIVPEQPSVLLCADHIERRGIEFFRLACERDLEGIVAKLKHGGYGEGWFKISERQAGVVRETPDCCRAIERLPADGPQYHIDLAGHPNLRAELVVEFSSFCSHQLDQDHAIR